MDDFLYALKMQLTDRLTPKQIDEQMKLYARYMQEQMAAGKTQEQVLRKLGDPAKIADLIVDSYEKRARLQMQETVWKKKGNATAEEINAQIQNPKHGFYAEFKENEGWDVRLGKLKLNSWYGTLIILGIVLAVFLVISELGRG